ncbi:MAG: hypothetical protein ACP5JW_05035 [Candidatus Bathyarchaeia archaeon]
MAERFKVLAFVAFLGFIAGIIADLTAEYVLPKLLEILPEIFRVRYILSGLVGAVLALILVAIWAYATKPTEA